MALTKRVLSASCTAGVHTLTLSDVAGLEVGYPIVVRGLNNNYDGQHTITAVSTTLLTVTFTQGNQSHPAVTSPGVLYVPVSWCDVTDLETFVGYEFDGTDLAYAESVVAAANEFSWRRRQTAGYTTDLPDAVPAPDVLQGVVLYAANLYRQRGSVGDVVAAFDPIATAAPIGTTAEILRLLGINRARIA